VANGFAFPEVPSKWSNLAGTTSGACPDVAALAGGPADRARIRPL